MFKIISDQTDFIVVDKNVDVNFHNEGEVGSGLFSQVKAYVKQHQNHDDLYPVHRLDKMTSGLVIFAKTQRSAKRFGELFEKHDIEKYYLAISDKKPTKKQGLIKGDMAKSRRGMFKLMRSFTNPAITQFFSYNIANNSIVSKQRLYLLKPHSGKTHQLRVALSSIGAPIVGDPLYNSSSIADRGYLHAYCVKFTYENMPYVFTAQPSTGEFFLSDSVNEQLSQLTEPWLLPWPKL